MALVTGVRKDRQHIPRKINRLLFRLQARLSAKPKRHRGKATPACRYGNFQILFTMNVSNPRRNARHAPCHTAPKPKKLRIRPSSRHPSPPAMRGDLPRPRVKPVRSNNQKTKTSELPAPNRDPPSRRPKKRSAPRCSSPWGTSKYRSLSSLPKQSRGSRRTTDQDPRPPYLFIVISPHRLKHNSATIHNQITKSKITHRNHTCHNNIVTVPSNPPPPNAPGSSDPHTSPTRVPPRIRGPSSSPSRRNSSIPRSP